MNKEDFKIFKNHKDLIYLDNAAASQTPSIVVEKMVDYYTNYRSNIDRGEYKIAERATAEYDSVRQKVAKFIYAENDEIIFTSGATDSSNKLILMLEKLFENSAYDSNIQKDEIVISRAAHHSDIVPLQEYAKRKGFKVLYGDQNISEKTLIVSHVLVSNITGEIFDVKETFAKSKKFKAFTICDATAAVGHMIVNVKELGADSLYFSAHKMCGPTGVGVLYIRRDMLRSMEPAAYGGGMVWEVTECKSSYRSDVKKFEAGTSNIAGVIGLGAAIDYLENIGLENIHKYIQDLTSYTLKKLEALEAQKKIKVFASRVINKNIGIVSFEVYKKSGEVIHSHDVAQVLGDASIAVRAGHHCSKLLINELSVESLTRVSLYFYNTKNDVDMLINTLEKVFEIFK